MRLEEAAAGGALDVAAAAGVDQLHAVILLLAAVGECGRARILEGLDGLA